MQTGNWQEELRSYKDKVGNSETLPCIFQAEVASVMQGPLLTVASDASLNEAVSLMSDEDSDFLLVQDSGVTIQGTVDRQTLEHMMSRPEIDRNQVSVSSIMTKDVCIESGNSTVAEVINRVTTVECPCVVIVDRLGNPTGIISARDMLFALEEFLPPEMPRATATPGMGLRR